MEHKKITRWHLVLKYMMEHEWVTIREMRTAEIGGDSADRRLRELRQRFGFDYEKKRLKKKDGTLSNTYLYRLTTSHELIDWENLKVKKAA